MKLVIIIIKDQETSRVKTTINLMKNKESVISAPTVCKKKSIIENILDLNAPHKII